MGEVYRATDTKLGRDVALKILPASFTKEPERIARFRREAQVLASLNHSHIAQVYGLDEADGTQFLVLEFVDGQSLDKRIARGPIPPDEALGIAKQIAEALEATHEKGIIHRDLKPANVALTRDGQVKVLDFGLAKAVEATGGAFDLANSPTITSPAMMTGAGVILGTAAYMAPEQARGKGIDKRADIWAFGCVLYEMLTGRRAFEGNDVPTTLALVMTKEPEWSALPAETPSIVRQLLARCLRKDPKTRMRDIGELRLQIDEFADADRSVDITRTRASRRVSIPITLLLAAMAAAVTGAIVWSMKPGPSSGSAVLARMTVSLPPNTKLDDLQYPGVALSPDGKQLVYAAAKAGIRQLYVRSLDDLEFKAIAGTEDATVPFFSPDGQWIGFFAGGKLKKVSVSGDVLQTLGVAPLGVGGSWGPDNTIYFSPSSVSGIWKIAASGGTAQPMTALDRAKGETSHRWPQVLPGGKAMLFTVWTGPGFEEMYIAVQSLESGQRQVLQSGADNGRYISSGHLVYARADTLMAVPMDLARLKVTSNTPVVLDERVWTGAQGAHYAVSDFGVLAYVPGDPKRYDRQLVWIDRSGRVEPLPIPAHAFASPQLSPDGGRLAVEIWEGTIGIWIYDFSRGTLTRLTSAGSSQQPTWAPDGRHVAYRATRGGSRNLFWMPTDGSGEEVRLGTSDNMQTPASFSPDGKWLAYHEIASNTGRAIWIVQPDGDRKPEVFLKRPANESSPRFSPDGRWMAFVSDDSGRAQVCVRPFPGPGGTSQISTLGGTEPIWSHDGRELFYLNGDKLLAVNVTTNPTLLVGTPRELFSGRYDTSVTNVTSYDVSPDGRRFLRVLPPETKQNATDIQVVINWTEELKARVPAK